MRETATTFRTTELSRSTELACPIAIRAERHDLSRVCSYIAGQLAETTTNYDDDNNNESRAKVEEKKAALTSPELR